MISSEEYITKVQAYFNFLIDDFNFQINKVSVNGNIYYNVEYINHNVTISISLETIENYIRVVIYKNSSKEISTSEDVKTLYLNVLTKNTLEHTSQLEFDLNNTYFKKFNPENGIDKMILKNAKDLRICLKSTTL